MKQFLIDTDNPKKCILYVGTSEEIKGVYSFLRYYKKYFVPNNIKRHPYLYHIDDFGLKVDYYDTNGNEFSVPKVTLLSMHEIGNIFFQNFDKITEYK